MSAMSEAPDRVKPPLNTCGTLDVSALVLAVQSLRVLAFVGLGALLLEIAVGGAFVDPLRGWRWPALVPLWAALILPPSYVIIQSLAFISILKRATTGARFIAGPSDYLAVASSVIYGLLRGRESSYIVSAAYDGPPYEGVVQLGITLIWAYLIIFQRPPDVSPRVEAALQSFACLPRLPARPRPGFLSWTLQRIPWIAGVPVVIIYAYQLPVPSVITYTLVVVAAISRQPWVRRRFLQPAFGERKSERSESTTLLLRAFRDMALSRTPGGTNVLDILANEFASFGPVLVAEHHSHGIGLVYPVVLNADKWQQEIRPYIRQAGWLVGTFGETEGVRWEYAQIVADQKLDRLVLLFPVVEADGLARRWEATLEALGLGACELPNSAPVAHESQRRVPLACIFVDMRPTVIIAPSKSAIGYTFALRAAIGLVAAQPSATLSTTPSAA